jgi:mannose-6-phosphate isomerase-like protein (cupin superfamily)
MAAPATVVRLDEKFAEISDHWQPKIVGQINGMHIKAVKIEGEFIWHSHSDTDEFFLVRSGNMTIQMRDRPDVVLGPDEFFIVPKGVEHRPVADAECEVLLLEPAGVVNTGDASPTDHTAPNDDWI